MFKLELNINKIYITVHKKLILLQMLVNNNK